MSSLRSIVFWSQEVLLCLRNSMEIRLRLLGALMKLVSWLLIPYYFILDRLPNKYCPKIQNDLLKLSIVQLAEKIRNGEVKSAQVVAAYIERIREVNPILNAMIDQRFEAAISEAVAVDRFLKTTPKSLELIKKETPLLGVPLTVKESCQVKGLSFTVGTIPRKGLKAKDDGKAVKQAKEAGAIILCVTNTPELCLSWETNNCVNGLTKNPYGTYRTAGGSSGGEAALIGAGASLGGLGSDIGGSIRIPALFNGIFGHKPTPGYISVEGHYPREPSYDTFLCIGPMVRYSEDLPLMMKVLTSQNVERLHLDIPVDLKKLNVFYREDAGFSLVTVGVDKDIIKAMRSAVKTFEKLGCKIELVNMPLLTDSVELSVSAMIEIDDLPDLLATSTKKNRGELGLWSEFLKSLFKASEFSPHGLVFALLLYFKFFIPDKERAKYIKLVDKLKSQFTTMLDENGIFLYPTFPLPAVHHNESFNKTPGVMYALLFNALGFPACHVTMGLGRNNLPIGIQVVAAPHQDRLCFAVAKELEKQFGGWVPPPSCD